MSPKSTIPLISPASSASALSVVRSPWTTWARSDGQTGTTVVSNRSRTSSTRRRWRSSRMEPSSSRDFAACWTSHSIVRSAAGWKKPRSPRPMRAAISPQPASAASDRSSASIRARPGSTEYIRTWCAPSSARTLARRAAGSPEPGDAPGMSRGMASGSSGSTRVAWRTASASMSSVAGSSAAFDTFMMASGVSSGPSSRNVWSRSLPRSRATAASTSKVCRAMSTAAPASNAGRAAARTGSMVSAW